MMWSKFYLLPFQLMYMFSGMLERTCLQAHFATKIPILLKQLHHEMDVCKLIYDRQIVKGDNAEIPKNMAPSTGRMFWVNSLKRRADSLVNPLKMIKHAWVPEFRAHCYVLRNSIHSLVFYPTHYMTFTQVSALRRILQITTTLIILFQRIRIRIWSSAPQKTCGTDRAPGCVRISLVVFLDSKLFKLIYEKWWKWLPSYLYSELLLCFKSYIEY